MARDDNSSFKVKTRGEVLDDLAAFSPLPAERVELGESWDRVLAEDVIAPEDVPSFDRSTRDGYAVRAAGTGGAGQVSPRRFEVVGEVVQGGEPGLSLAPGQAVRIWTGAMLPPARTRW